MNGKILTADDPRLKMMQQTFRAQQSQETIQIMSICTQLATNRDKLEESERGYAVVQEADRILLAWLKGISAEAAE